MSNVYVCVCLFDLNASFMKNWHFKTTAIKIIWGGSFSMEFHGIS